jgi:hypothetical protein
MLVPVAMDFFTVYLGLPCMDKSTITAQFGPLHKQKKKVCVKIREKVLIFTCSNACEGPQARSH